MKIFLKPENKAAKSVAAKPALRSAPPTQRSAEHPSSLHPLPNNISSLPAWPPAYPVDTPGVHPITRFRRLVGPPAGPLKGDEEPVAEHASHFPDGEPGMVEHGAPSHNSRLRSLPGQL
jgi:hypothetical protein